MAATLMSVGELRAARTHFEAALGACAERSGRPTPLGSDLGVFVRAWYAHVLWLTGDEAMALTASDEAIAEARRIDHRHSQALALAYAALLHQLRLDAPATRACDEAVVDLCERYGFVYYGDWARVLLGWVRGRETPVEGVELIVSALGRLDVQRALARRPYFLSLLADTPSSR